MEDSERVDVAVIGAGPAGLAAAEVISAAGRTVTIFEAMPSPARKFLMAGKSGLNLTKNSSIDHVRSVIDCARMDAGLSECGPSEIVAWAQGLGETMFTGSTGRVFPKAMKASPLLRRWLARLSSQGCTLRTRWRWTGWADTGALRFQTVEARRDVFANAAVLALGGASWPRLGSDGAWVPVLAGAGVPSTPLRPANMGFDVDWSRKMIDAFAGAPVKPIAVSCGSTSARGEFVVTETGVEGGCIYALAAPIRDALANGAGGVVLDLMPDVDVQTIRHRLSRPRGRNSWSNHLRKVLRLTGVRKAMLNELGPASRDPDVVAHSLKALPLPLTRSRPLAEAISTAGGVAWDALTEDLMLAERPGIFVAGEMLDWEAPTGGYLLTGCLASGRLAGKSVVAWLERR